MRKIIFLFFLAVAQEPFCTTDEIVAWVNGEVITKSEVSALLGRPEEALSLIINQRLLLQEARKRFSVTKEEVEERLKRIKEDFSKEEEFYAALSSEGIDEGSLRKRIEEELLRQKMIASIREKIAVPEKRVLESLSQYEEEINVSYLIFEEKKEAEEAFLLFKQKGIWPKEAEESGFFTAPEMKEGFSKACFALEEGEISHPTLIDGKFYLILCKKRQPTSLATLKRIKDELLLEQEGRIGLSEEKDKEEILNDISELIEEGMKREELSKKISQLIGQLREKAYIKVRSKVR